MLNGWRDVLTTRVYDYMNNKMFLTGMMLPALAATMLVGPLGAQETRAVSLADAVAIARDNHPDVAISEARARGARQQVTVAGASRWPVLGLEAGVLASNDPVAAFGGRLRQGRFTQADFDPAQLNAPDALTDLDGAVVMGWAPVDFSRDAALVAARGAAEAAELGTEWMRRVAGYQAEVRFVEAVGAELMLEAAEAAVAAAEANLARAESHVDEGMVTTADVLQARAALEDARARDITSRQAVDDARTRLALAMGWSADVVPVPDTDALVLAGAPPSTSSGSERADLTASEVQVRVAAARVSQTGRARLPTLQAFARIEAHTDEAFSNHGDSWSVGLRVRVPLFSGFELGARRDAARAELTAASLEHDRRLNEGRAALDEARRGAESRRRAALAAEAAAEAATEAARLVRLRYEEGLATTAELLAAESAAVRHATAAVHARLDHRIVSASLLLLDDPRLHTLSGQGVDR